MGFEMNSPIENSKAASKMILTALVKELLDAQKKSSDSIEALVEDVEDGSLLSALDILEEIKDGLRELVDKIQTVQDSLSL